MTSEATPPVGGAGIKAPETTPSAAESDRLKSLMDRLSSQQSLLKPAEKPSVQMQHYIDQSSKPLPERKLSNTMDTYKPYKPTVLPSAASILKLKEEREGGSSPQEAVTVPEGE